MELKEKKQLKEITAAFAEAVQKFRLKQDKEAFKSFSEIVEKYSDSEFYGVLEVQTRAKVYQSIVEGRLNPQKLSLNGDQDCLQHGIYQLNSGKYDEARAMFLKLQQDGNEDPFLDYLLAISYKGLDDQENLLASLEKCCAKDGYYKILAYNEPDFLDLRDNQEYLSLVE